MNTSTKRKLRPALQVICSLLSFAGFCCFFSGRWFVRVYGRIGFDSIFYTLTSGLGGVQTGLIFQYLLQAFLPCILCTGLAVCFLILQPWQQHGKYAASSRKHRPISLIWSALLSLGLIIFAAFDVELVDYILNQNFESNLYESYYADPEEVSISFPEEKRNLIYIILESMETSYLSQDLGGAMSENLIPELYQLAENNLCFSNSTAKVGGYYTTSGATWTIGSMVAQTAGIPLKTPTEDCNQYGVNGERFLPGAVTIMDLLSEAGYYQALMVGSSANFGGRRSYYQQHGVDKIYDLYTAREDGIVPSDYYVWWGMEDLHLFEYAKQELVKIASQDAPFAFTMLTVDTHHVGGYQCAQCTPSTSGETYDQSISCSSRQVAAFIQWIQAQDFYENTTIVIVGDHESMDNGYFLRNVDDSYQRLIYNCFINTPTQASSVVNRQFAAIDLFPTTLAAIGCEIEGDRLGLGTNLFSQTPTLMECMGFTKLNTELAKGSDFYESHFYE